MVYMYLLVVAAFQCDLQKVASKPNDGPYIKNHISLNSHPNLPPPISITSLIAHLKHTKFLKGVIL